MPQASLDYHFYEDELSFPQDSQCPLGTQGILAK